MFSNIFLRVIDKIISYYSYWSEKFNPHEDLASSIVLDAGLGFLEKVERKLSIYDYTSFETDYKNQALVESAAMGKEKVVSALLKAGANPNVRVTSADETAFCAAIIFNRVEVVKTFIADGKVSINSPQCGTPEHKYTPLEQAHEYEDNNSETIKLLLEAGADTRSYNGETNNYFGEMSYMCQEN